MHLGFPWDGMLVFKQLLSSFKYNKVSINLLLAIGRYDFHIYAIYAIVGKGNEIPTYLYKTGRQDNN